MRTTALIVANMAILLVGCEASIRQPAQSAMLGALDAFDRPPEDAELAQKIGKLANRYVDKALAAEPMPSLEELSARATRGALRGFGETAIEYGPAFATALSGSLRMATGTLEQQSPLFGRMAGRIGNDAARGVVRGFGRDPQALALLQSAAFGAGRAMTSGVADELARRTDIWVGVDGRGPLGDAIGEIAARSGEYAIAGALAAVRHDLQTCVPGRGDMCLADITQSLSRAAGRGASEGVQREFDWLTASIAFVAGLVSAVIAGIAITELRSRRRMRI